MTNLDLNPKKQHLLEAAITVFSAKGFEKASMRDIASAAGLTTGALYHHYKNKDDLFYDAVKHTAYFVHRLSEFNEHKQLKSRELIFDEIQQNVKLRMSKAVEQRLLILLTAYAISHGGTITERYKSDYTEIIHRVAEMFTYAFGVDNKAHQTQLASILTAALDGVAIQYSLGILDIHDDDFKETFVRFFAESIPLYLQKHPDTETASNAG